MISKSADSLQRTADRRTEPNGVPTKEHILAISERQNFKKTGEGTRDDSKKGKFMASGEIWADWPKGRKKRSAAGEREDWGEELEVSAQRLEGGEVSPFLRQPTRVPNRRRAPEKIKCSRKKELEDASRGEQGVVEECAMSFKSTGRSSWAGRKRVRKTSMRVPRSNSRLAGLSIGHLLNKHPARGKSLGAKGLDGEENLKEGADNCFGGS